MQNREETEVAAVLSKFIASFKHAGYVMLVLVTCCCSCLFQGKGQILSLPKGLSKEGLLYLFGQEQIIKLCKKYTGDLII